MASALFLLVPHIELKSTHFIHSCCSFCFVVFSISMFSVVAPVLFLFVLGVHASSARARTVSKNTTLSLGTTVGRRSTISYDGKSDSTEKTNLATDLPRWVYSNCFIIGDLLGCFFWSNNCFKSNCAFWGASNMDNCMCSHLLNDLKSISFWCFLAYVYTR